MPLIQLIITATALSTMSVAGLSTSIIQRSPALAVASVVMGVIALGMILHARKRWNDADPELLGTAVLHHGPYPATTPCPSWCNGKHNGGVNDYQDAIHESNPVSAQVTNPDGSKGDKFSVTTEQYPEQDETLAFVYMGRQGDLYDTHLTLTYAEALALSALLEGAGQQIMPPEVRSGEAILETVPA